jgi:hypothetical protein
LTLLGERQHVLESQALGVEAQAPIEVGCLDGDVVEPTACILRLLARRMFVLPTEPLRSGPNVSVDSIDFLPGPASRGTLRGGEHVGWQYPRRPCLTLI